MSSRRTIETAIAPGLLTQAMDPILRMAGFVHDDESLQSIVLTAGPDGNYQMTYTIDKEVKVIHHN